MENNPPFLFYTPLFGAIPWLPSGCKARVRSIFKQNLPGSHRSTPLVCTPLRPRCFSVNFNSLVEEESVKAKAVIVSMDERSERKRLAVQASMPETAILDGPRSQQGYRRNLHGIRSGTSTISFPPAGGSTVKQVQYLKTQSGNSAAEGEEAFNDGDLAGVAGPSTTKNKTWKHHKRVMESRGRGMSPPEDVQEAPRTKWKDRSSGWKDCGDSSRWNPQKANTGLDNAT